MGHVERLTNIRFANDVMPHSKAESELVYILETCFKSRAKLDYS